MKFDKPNCPECGEIAIGTVDMVPARSRIFQTADGSFEYEGDTELFWETQYSVGQDGFLPSKDGEPLMLECEEGHEWPALMLDDEPEVTSEKK